MVPGVFRDSPLCSQEQGEQQVGDLSVSRLLAEDRYRQWLLSGLQSWETGDAPLLAGLLSTQWYLSEARAALKRTC